MERTPPLDEFLAKYEADDNEWWRLDSGHHQNLFEAAMDRVEELEAENERLRGVCGVLRAGLQGAREHLRGWNEYAGESAHNGPFDSDIESIDESLAAAESSAPDNEGSK